MSSAVRLDFGESFSDRRPVTMFEEGGLHQGFEIALHKERQAQSKIDRQQRRLDEMQAQLFESIEQKQQLTDQVFLASQEKVRALRELRKVDNERKALRSTLAQLQESGTLGGHKKVTRHSSRSAPLLKSVQSELERLQQQMESTSIVYEENERLKRECHSLAANLADVRQELEVFSQKQAQKQTTQAVGAVNSAGKDADALFTVRHRRQDGLIKVTAEILIASIDGGKITPNGHEIPQPGDRILELNGMRADELSASHVQNIVDSSREVLMKISRPRTTSTAHKDSSLRLTNQRSPGTQNGAKKGDLKIRRAASPPYAIFQPTTEEHTKGTLATDKRIGRVAPSQTAVNDQEADQLSPSQAGTDQSAVPGIDLFNQDAMNSLKTNKPHDSSVAAPVTVTALCSKKGGLLHMQETGVSLIIPQDAQSYPCQISVSASYEWLTSLSQFMEKEYIVSPIVTVHPMATRFKKPAELQVPHCVATEFGEWSLTVLCRNSVSDDSTTWRKVAHFNNGSVSPNRSTLCRLGHNHVNIRIEDGATFCLVGSPKRMQVAVFCENPSKEWNFSVQLVSDQRDAVQQMYASQLKAGFEMCCPYSTFPLFKGTEDLSVVLSSRSESWTVSPQAQIVSPGTCEIPAKPSPPVDFIFRSNTEPLPRLQARIAIQRGEKSLVKSRFTKKFGSDALSALHVSSDGANKPAGKRLSVPSILSLSVVSQLAILLDRDNHRGNNWKMLAKYLRFDHQFVEELQSQSDRHSPTEQILRAWQPEIGIDVRKVLWKILNAIGRTDAADVIIPIEEINQTSGRQDYRRPSSYTPQSSRRSQAENNCTSTSTPERRRPDRLVVAGEQSPRSGSWYLSRPRSPRQPARENSTTAALEKGNHQEPKSSEFQNHLQTNEADISDNDSTDVNFDGKAETEWPHSPQLLRAQSQSTTPKLEQREFTDPAVRQYRTASNQDFTRPLTPVPFAQGPGAHSPRQEMKKRQRHRTADGKLERRPPKASTNTVRKGVIGSAKSEPRLHSLPHTRTQKRSSEGGTRPVSKVSFTTSNEEKSFPSVLETFL